MRAQLPAQLPAQAEVLIVRLSALGDVIFALETLSSLKQERPDVQVDFLIEDRFASLLEGHPLLRQLLIFPRLHKWRYFGHLRRLRRRRYDAALDLHGITKSGLQVLCCRARRKLGYSAPGAREGAAIYYKEKVQLPDPLPHRAERGLYLLRALGLEGGPCQALLPFSKYQGQADMGEGRVVLHPGTSTFATFKRWPRSSFAELGRRLLARGIEVLCSHGPGEEALTARLVEEAPGLVSVDGSELGLQGLAGLLREVDVLVAADTGPLHIAAAMGTKVVALFGPKDEKLYGPRGEGHQVLFEAVPCRPCRRRACASPQCVLGIGVDAVEDSVLRSLQKVET